MAHHHTHKRAAGILASGALAALALSSSAGAGQPGTESFSGVCELGGTVRHQPPLTQEPVPTEIHGRFSGTCSGVVTDGDGRTRQLIGAPARYEVRDAGGALSCLGGAATGTGRLLVDGDEIQFGLTERRPGPGVAVVTLEGAAGGSASVVGTVSPREDLQELNERCNGSGVRLIHGDARLESPGISG